MFTALLLLTASPFATAATGVSTDLGVRWVDDGSTPVTPGIWLDISATGTHLPLADDDSETVPLPFTFRAPSGASYQEVKVNSNGALYFGANRWTRYSNGCDWSDMPESTILLYWDDLNPASGGDVQWEVVNTSQGLLTIVQWTDVPRYGTNDTVTMQAVLSDQGVVELRYRDMTPTGSSATIGIQSGGDILQYSCNTPSLTNGRVVRFQELTVGQDADADGADVFEDCDDADPTVFPGALDIAGDGRDDNCDGTDDLIIRTSGGFLGGPAVVEVVGVEPGQSASILLSTTGPGAGPCPAILQGACSGLQSPTLLTDVVADVLGVARYVQRVPLQTPQGTTLWLEGWTLQPNLLGTEPVSLVLR